MRKYDVGLRHEQGVELHGRDIARGVLHQGVEDAALYGVDFLLRAGDFLLVFLQFLGDIALGGGKRLLAYPLGGHLVLVGVAHLYIVSEDVVEGDFERGYSGAFYLALLYGGEGFLAVGHEVAELVEFGVHSGGDGRAFAELRRRVGGDSACDGVHEVVERVDAGGHVADYLCRSACQQLFQARSGGEAVTQREHVAGLRAQRGHTRDKALEVAHGTDDVARGVPLLRVVEEILHGVEPLVDGLDVEQREEEVAMQEARSHRRYGMVEHLV